MRLHLPFNTTPRLRITRLQGCGLSFLKSALAFVLILSVCCGLVLAQTRRAPRQATAATPRAFEYLWFEAENMRGLSLDERNEPRLNPSWMNLTSAQSPGWGINGPGVSAEWSQGGESEWNSIAASADEKRANVFQELEIPRAGRYRVWVRYADWAARGENFVARIEQGGRELLRQEFGARDVIDPHDEMSMYWQWAFAWDASEPVMLEKGAARVSLNVEGTAEARRHVDCVLVTNDLDYKPEGRRKPPFAAMRALREWSAEKRPLAPLITTDAVSFATPARWQRPAFAGRDFQMPWNVSETFWDIYDQPATARPLYPFNAEPVGTFIERYKGARDVPIFSSKLVVPVVYINYLSKHLREGSPFLRYLRETRSPFAVLINYGALTLSPAEGEAMWKLLQGELREQFLGWISGESIGHVWADVANSVRRSPEMPRRELLEAYRVAYTRALEKKWSDIFHVRADAMWDRLIPAQATSTTTYAHALGRWGTKLIGMETAAVQPNTAMRIAFVRGAARQYGAGFLYYHAPNFGDTATTFTTQQNYAGPEHFFHTRYGATMGPSLSWYRKNYYLYYMAGASAIYLEQGFDQFFQPGPGQHPFQLNPLGRITDEFMRFAEKHPARGTPYTPVAFLLDPAHGWEMTDYPHLPFGVSPIERGDHALRELFNAAYYPTAVNEGEPATADRQAFTDAVFGDIFDVLVASKEQADAIDSYRAVIAGGRINWTPEWAERLTDYVSAGGTVVINAAQASGLPEDLLGVRLSNSTDEADDAECLSPGESKTDLSGQVYRFQKLELRGAQTLIRTRTGDPLVTVQRLGRGRLVFCAIPDLLGLDERFTTTAAHLLAHLLGDAAPVRVQGEIQYMLNRTERGWAVTLINNRGVYKPQQGLAEVRREESSNVSINLRGARLESASEWTTGTPLNVTRGRGQEHVSILVPAGGVRIVELLPRP